MKIDAHMHVNFNNYTAKSIIGYLDKNQFDCCWLMTWEEVDHGKWHYEHLSIEDVYETYLRYTSRIIPMYAPDPRQKDAKKKLIYWHNKGIRGCGELKVALNWQSDKLNDLLPVVSELKLPLLFHMEESSDILIPLELDNSIEVFCLKLMRSNKLFGFPKKIINIFVESFQPFKKWKSERTRLFPGYMLDFASLEVILNNYPNINFIGHGPLFWKCISANGVKNSSFYPKGEIKGEGIMYKLLRRYPNLYADISGMSGFNALNRDHKFSKGFVADFSHKLIFGTDNTMLGHEILLKSFDLDRSKMKQILGENAIRLLDRQGV